ncbi:MAG: hypothetical protein U0521_13080 [Anaerolineae bacterium]
MVELLQKPNESLTQEIERAVARRRDIVPLRETDVPFNISTLPKDMSGLRRYYALPLTPETLAGDGRGARHGALHHDDIRHADADAAGARGRRSPAD